MAPLKLGDLGMYSKAKLPKPVAMEHWTPLLKMLEMPKQQIHPPEAGQGYLACRARLD